MESVDQQLRQLKENYARMTEDEICALADDAYDLTDIAREALQAVITEQGFTVRLKLEAPARPLAEPPDNDDDDDEGLIIYGWPDNAEDARLTMGALSAAGIPSFLGPDHVMHLEEFRGRFNGPVSLKVRAVDRNRAFTALRRAAAAGWWGDDKEEEDPGEEKDFAVLCPKCSSTKVVMEGRDTDLAEPPPTANFQWSCDACGHRWVDEGIVREVAGGQSWPGEEFPSRNEGSSGPK
jgi:DNA-directed RNA polymerase subunit M/transcription elongation factor TFIIS